MRRDWTVVNNRKKKSLSKWLSIKQARFGFVEGRTDNQIYFYDKCDLLPSHETSLDHMTLSYWLIFPSNYDWNAQLRSRHFVEIPTMISEFQSSWHLFKLSG